MGYKQIDNPRSLIFVRTDVSDGIEHMNIASAMVEGAEMTLRRPVSSLRPYLGCFWSIETTPDTRLRTLPDTCTTLTVELSEGARPECFLVGPRFAPIERVPAVGQVFFGVRLLPGVAFALTGIPVYRLAERRTRLAAVLPKDAPRFERCLAKAQTVQDRFDVLEEFLVQRLVGMHVDSRVERAFKGIEDSAGQIRMAQLARECRISPRHLHRLVRQWVGFAPKRVARIIRFQAVLKRMETEPAGNSQGVPADLGYFDQAHLTNEMTQFVGASPARIVAHHVADFSKTRCE
jgi:AraC-like DNA-binding protein